MHRNELLCGKGSYTTTAGPHTWPLLPGLDYQHQTPTDGIILQECLGIVRSVVRPLDAS